MMYRIDWNDVMSGYNKKYKKNYTNLKTWLEEYYKETCSINIMGEQLGIDVSSLNKKLRSFDIMIQGRGGNYEKRAVKAKAFLKISALRMKNMTIYDIMKDTGMCFSHAFSLSTKYNRTFKRLRKGPTPHNLR